MDEFKRAVFDAVYRSWPQRRLRLVLGALLAIKHTLRGMLFSWPLYLLAAAGLALPDTAALAWAFLLLPVPAVIVSVYILQKGWREDYDEHVRGRLLKRRHVRQILLGAR